MKWSELKESQRGAGGRKPPGWKTRALLDQEREAERDILRKDYDRFKQVGERKAAERRAEAVGRVAPELNEVNEEFNPTNRTCESCDCCLGQEDVYDLIEGHTGYVCANCYQKPAYARDRYLAFKRAVAVKKFESLSTLRSDVMVRFQKLSSAERAQ